MLMGLGFSPLAAAGLSLIADTATVAFGALGTPIQALAQSTGYDPFVLGQLIGRQSSFFAILIPFWLVFALVGWRKMWDVWPAILVAGISFAVPQYIISNYINPWIVDIAAGGIAMASLILFLRVWQPKTLMTNPAMRFPDDSHSDVKAPAPLDELPTGNQVFKAWLPWIILCVVLAFWATAFWKQLGNSIFDPIYHVPGLDKMILAMPPAVRVAMPQAGAFNFTFLTYSGTGVLVWASSPGC